MKIDFLQEIIDFDGSVVEYPKFNKVSNQAALNPATGEFLEVEKMTLGLIAKRALDKPGGKDGKPLGLEEQLKRGKWLKAISDGMDNKQPVEFRTDEIGVIKDLISKEGHRMVVMYRVNELFENGKNESEKTKTQS